MKILLTEGQAISCGDIDFSIFNRFGEITVCQNMKYDELEREIKKYDALLCNKLNVDKNIIDKAVNLKYIGECATGYNNIDIKYAHEKGITVCNAGSYSTNAVAQQVFGYILNYFSKISLYDNFVKADGWIKSPVFSPIVFQTDELKDKTLGIVGYGSIGKKVSSIAKAFDMNVLVYTRTVRQDGETNFVSFDELLNNSDIVSVHCPLTESNFEMFNKETFDKFKNGAYFINTARGGLVSENDLYNALQDVKLGGAAIDVLQTEPMTADNILIKAKNITITPHSAWVPTSTRQRLINIVADNIRAYLNGTPTNVV